MGFSEKDIWEFRFILPSDWKSGDVSVMLIETVSEERARLVFHAYYAQVVADTSVIRIISVECLWVNNTNPMRKTIPAFGRPAQLTKPTAPQAKIMKKPKRRRKP